MNEPEVTYDRGFGTLFEDGVRLLMACENNHYDYDTQFSFARASIVCSMMLSEVSANICIELLQLEKSIFRDIDRLSPISKFDFYLRTSFRDRKIDKGIHVIQSLQELKKLRDKYVHPKKSKVTWIAGENDSQYGTSDRTELLDMSANPGMWCSEDAINAMKGVHKFLSYFFRIKCKYSKKMVTSLLFSDEPILATGEPSVYYYDKTFHSCLSRWEVDISYFKIGKL